LDSSANNMCLDEYIDPPMSEPDFDCEIWREHSDPEAYLNCILIAG